MAQESGKNPPGNHLDNYIEEALGNEWVEVEPGIYEHRPIHPDPDLPPLAADDHHLGRRASGF